MNITVGKANVTDNIANILSIWQDSDNEVLREHIETINSVQDFLCRILTEESAESRATIGSLLGDIVCVKDDLKRFINGKGTNHEKQR